MFYTYDPSHEIQHENFPNRSEVTKDPQTFVDCVISSQPCSTPVGNGEAIKNIVLENDFESTFNFKVLLRTFLSGP